MRRKIWHSCMSAVYLLLQACSTNPSTSIPFQVKPYVAEFVKQASLRGITLDTSGLFIVYVNNLKDEEGYPVNGQYIRSYFPFRKDLIELDTTAYWWGHLYSREKVIFHELGHCLLDREHNFDTLPGGLPRSIMGITKHLTYEFMTSYRAYYLDELFNPATADPCWIKPLGCGQKQTHKDLQTTTSPYELPASPQQLLQSR